MNVAEISKKREKIMKTSKKKLGILTAIIIIVVAAIGLAYVWPSLERVEVQTHSYLLDKGYTNADISTINVKFSFANLFTAKSEWTSTVVFMDEPDVKYYFTLEDGKIVSAGVSGDSPAKSELQ